MSYMIKRLAAGLFIAVLLMNTVFLPVTKGGETQAAAQNQPVKKTAITARVNYGVLKIRPSKGTSASPLKILHYNDRVTVLTTGSKWVKVRSGRVTGYARGKFLTTSDGGTAAESLGFTKGKQVVNFALQFVGNPYVWGGESLTHGADCSGFIKSVYRHFNINLPHSSAAQRHYGKAVSSLKLAQPGDIICYDGHVALYMGNRKIVHASSRRTGIKVSNNAAYRKIICIRRMF